MKVTDSEKKWAQEQGLKKTNLRMMDYHNGRYIDKVVYRANDGKLYYIQQKHFAGTFESYCHEA